MELCKKHNMKGIPSVTSNLSLLSHKTPHPLERRGDRFHDRILFSVESQWLKTSPESQSSSKTSSSNLFVSLSPARRQVISGSMKFCPLLYAVASCPTHDRATSKPSKPSLPFPGPTLYQSFLPDPLTSSQFRGEGQPFFPSPSKARPQY